MYTYNRGDAVCIRRYKDMCCEYEVQKDGCVIAPYIFSYKFSKFCGRAYEIRDRDIWGDDEAYQLNVFEYSAFWFKDYLLEEVK